MQFNMKEVKRENIYQQYSLQLFFLHWLIFHFCPFMAFAAFFCWYFA